MCFSVYTELQYTMAASKSMIAAPAILLDIAALPLLVLASRPLLRVLLGQIRGLTKAHECQECRQVDIHPLQHSGSIELLTLHSSSPETGE